MNKTYCFFSARYLPYLGGVERYTYNISKELSKSNNKIIIVTSRIGKEPEFEEKDNIKIFRLPSCSLLNGRFPVTKYCKRTKQTINTIKKLSPDYVIVNTRFYILSYVGAVFAKKNRIPAIVIEHGTGHFTVNNKFFDFAGHLYEHFISLLVKRNIKDYFGVSRECNKWLKHFKIDAKGVLYNAVDVNEIADLSKIQNKEIEEQIKYETTDIIITFTGRLIQEKGILKLIAAFQKIKKTFPNAKLCIAGDGELYDAIFRRQYDGVFLLGKLSFKNVIGLLRITTVFCLPTDYPEGLPTSVLEAISCKNFVITSSSGGAKEIITDLSLGIIMENNTVEEIQESIIYALSDNMRRKSSVENVYKKVVENFTWSSTAGKLEGVFDEK